MTFSAFQHQLESVIVFDMFDCLLNNNHTCANRSVCVWRGREISDSPDVTKCAHSGHFLDLIKLAIALLLLLGTACAQKEDASNCCWPHTVMAANQLCLCIFAYGARMRSKYSSSKCT